MPKIILFVFLVKGCGFAAGKRAGMMRCGLAPAAVFLKRHLPTGKVFFLQKNVKNGKKGAIY